MNDYEKLEWAERTALEIHHSLQIHKSGLPYLLARAAGDFIYRKLIDALTIVQLTAPAWQPIESAPIDGTEVLVYLAPREGLRAFQCVCAYHPDAEWCADELREVTHWQPLSEPPVT